MDIKLDNGRKKAAIDKIRLYFQDEHEESIGDLKADMLIEFFLREIAPAVYNQAIEDAHAFMQDKLMDLEGILYVEE